MTSVAATTQAPAPAAPPAPAPDAPVVPASLKEAKAAIRAKMRGEPAAKPAETPAPTTEAPATPAPELKPDAKPQDERVAKAFRQIQQRDGELRKERETLAAERKAHEAELAEAKALKEQTELYKKDPVAWLQKHGGPDAYKRLTDWKLAGDKQPVDEQVKTALERAAAAEKAIEEERAARAKEREEAEQRAREAASAAQVNAYKAQLASQFTADERATAKLFGVADLEQSALDYVREEYIPALRERGLDDAAIETELTHEKIAVKVKEILKKQLEELKGNSVLQGIFGPAQAAAPQQAPKPAPQQARAPSLNNTMSATTDVGLGDLSLAERKRLVHKRHR